MKGFDPFVFFRSILAITMTTITLVALVRGIKTWRNLPDNAKKRVMLVLSRHNFITDILVTAVLLAILLALIAVQFRFL